MTEREGQERTRDVGGGVLEDGREAVRKVCGKRRQGENDEDEEGREERTHRPRAR